MRECKICHKTFDDSWKICFYCNASLIETDKINIKEFQQKKLDNRKKEIFFFTLISALVLWCVFVYTITGGSLGKGISESGRYFYVILSFVYAVVSSILTLLFSVYLFPIETQLKILAFLNKKPILVKAMRFFNKMVNFLGITPSERKIMGENER